MGWVGCCVLSCTFLGGWVGYCVLSCTFLGGWAVVYLVVLSWVGGLCTLLVWTSLVVLACESLHVCTVCIWCCEHARFHVDSLVHHIIITFSFICCVLTGSAAQVCSSCCTQLMPGEAMRQCDHQGVTSDLKEAKRHKTIKFSSSLYCYKWSLSE